MKNYLKTIVTFIFLMAAVAFVPTTSEAALSTPTNLRQTRATDNSVEFTWDTVIGAYDYYTSISDGMAWSEPERAWDIKESYSKLSAGRTTQTAGTSLPTGNTGTVLTAPATPSTSNFGVYTGSAPAGTITFQASDPNRTANGYELEVRNLKGKLIKTISCSSTYSASTKFRKNTPYKYRVRLYATNGVTKMYSGWSGYRYFWISNVTGKKHYSLRSSNAKIKLKWAKVSGTKGYNVLMSTSRDGKYKKVKSLSKKAKSVTLTKFGKKRLNKYKTYYIKVVAKIKVGKKTVSNDAQLINYNY